VSGNEHKKQRKLMNPVFTAAHVSKLSPLFYRIAVEVVCSLTSKSDATEKHGLASGQTVGGDKILV
jgi:cytochrome P450